ncbi:MAG: imidazolonepropionase [Caldilineaceae bacterium]|nr:imidazolonepropionase [Caldilineaceae bacterium]
MTQRIDLLILNAAQLVTCMGDDCPRRRGAMDELHIVEDGAVAVSDGLIVDVGPSARLRAAYRAGQEIDASDRAVIPGLVDPHTHVVFGGDRADEFELRIRGASYMEIMAAGGGIRSTVARTRAATEAELIAAARRRLDEMLACGTTTVEIKSGYGLDTATELKMLRVIEELDRIHPCTLIPTFLGAHTLPPEYAEDGAGYVDLMIEEMIPAVAAWYAASRFAAGGRPFFIDAFCEEHAFDVGQSRRILAAGKAAGMTPKLHADQFNALGGVEMAVGLGAVSVDHLEVSGTAEIALLAQSDTLAVPLPAANFNLGECRFAPARELVDAGAALALATDLNPGSAPCFSMALVMAIACRYQRLLPGEALLAATINAAHAVNMAATVGSIEAGKQADLLILKASDYRHVAYFLGGNPVELVIKAGSVIRADRGLKRNS